MTKNISIVVAFLTGLGLLFIGTRFLLAPETAEAGYGIHFNEQGDYSFHYIKGIRDVFAGLLICILILTRQTKALAITLLTGTIIPVADMLIVLSKGYNGIIQAVPHIVAIIVCFVSGLILLINKKNKKTNYDGYAGIIQPQGRPGASVIEYNIVPNESTPWHYHTLFTETFEVLEGELELGHNNQVRQLKKGDIAVIRPREKHYFHNRTNNACLLNVTVSPANKDFQNSLLILKGLAKEGLATASGVPKRLADLAIFIYLNNSRMVGLQKLAEPFFDYVAKRAIKSGRLKELEFNYCEKHKQ